MNNSAIQKQVPLIKSLSTRYSGVMMPYLKEKKNQRYSSLAFTLIAIIFFGLFAVNPTLSTIANLQRQLEDNKEINQKLQTKIDNLNKLRIQFQQLKNDLPLIYQALPQEPTVTELAAQLQAIAATHQVGISRMQIQQIELTNKNPLANRQSQLGVGQYTVFNFSFDITGQYDSLLEFITAVGSFQRIVTIENISITSGSSLYTLSLRAKTYYKQ